MKVLALPGSKQFPTFLTYSLLAILDVDTVFFLSLS